MSGDVIESDPLRPRNGVAKAILFVTLMLAFVGLTPIALFGGETASVDATVGDGDTLRQAVFVLLFGISIWNTWRDKTVSGVLQVPLGVLLVLAWCWLSLTWAIAPEIAVRRLVFTTMVVLIVGQCCNAMSINGVIRTFFWALLITILIDWLAIAALPLAVHQAGSIEPELAGDWRGIHSHKNVTGGICAVGLFTFLYMWKQTRSRYVIPLLLLLTVVFLLNSHSKTSLGLVPVALVLGGAISIFHQSLYVRIAAGLTLVLAIIGVGVYYNKIADYIYLLDDPSALTGRSQIWPILFRYYLDHPLLGAGYGSFWSIGPDSPINQYASGWIVSFLTHAHNGYIDILVQTGLSGLILTVLALIVVPLYALCTIRFSSEYLRWYLSTLLVFGLLHNLLETSLLDRLNPVWLSMLIAYCLLDRAEAQASSLKLSPHDGLRSRVREAI